MKLKKALSMAAVLAMAVTPLAAYTAAAEEKPAAEAKISGELTLEGECDEFGNITIGDLWFTPIEGSAVEDLVDDSTGLAVGVAPGKTKTITEAVIPSYVKVTDPTTGATSTHPVTFIGHSAAGGVKSGGHIDASFNGCANLKSVTIPDTVTTIATGAFTGCSSLTSIRLPKNMSLWFNTAFDAIFEGCDKLTSIEVDPENTHFYSEDGVLLLKKSDGSAKLICYPAAKTGETYIIPDDVGGISSPAFYKCSFTSLYVPQSANSAIHYSIFSECSNLTDVYFEGTEEEWNSVTHYYDHIDDRIVDTSLENATIHFNAKKTDVDPDAPADDNSGDDDNTSADDNNSNSTGDTSKPTTPAVKPTNLNRVEEDKAISIGAGVKITLSEKDVEKFEEEKYEKYNLTATAEAVEEVKDGDKWYVRTDDNANSAVKGLDKALKKEIAKIESKNFKIINIDLADGDYVETTSPVAIKITVNLDKDYNVYHVSGKTVEKLKSSSRKMTDGKYEISFTTKNFSPFIFTTADLKNAGGTTSDGEPTSAATSNGSTTNPDTGIALAIAPVVLAAGAVAVVALKKKH